MINEGTDSIDRNLHTTEIVEHAKREIEKLDNRNAKRSSKPTKTQVENETVKLDIIKFLAACEEGTTATNIAGAVGISVQKASALCRQLVDEGRLTVEEVKVPKKGKQKAYTMVETDEEKTV